MKGVTEANLVIGSEKLYVEECTGRNLVSGTSQFPLLSLPRAIYGAGQETLGHFLHPLTS